MTMESGAAQAAAAELNNTDFMGRTIRVNEAAPPGEGGGRRGGYGGGGGGYGGGRGGRGEGMEPALLRCGAGARGRPPPVHTAAAAPGICFLAC